MNRDKTYTLRHIAALAFIIFGIIGAQMMRDVREFAMSKFSGRGEM